MFALRVSLSVVIAAGLSLWFGWERPMWAMFAVIYPALGDRGESLHKGMLRLGATFVGGALSLLITALFNDERWLFGGAVMTWVLICTFMMHDNRRWYFWFHSTILVVLMPIYSSEQPALAFEVVMLRVQETLLGVAVYTLVANVIFPDRRRDELINNMRDQVKAVANAFTHLIDAYRGDATVLADNSKVLDLRNEAVALHTSFRVRIDAGITENFDLVENRDAWHRVIDDLEAIILMMNRLRLSLGDVHPGRLGRELPELSAITDEITRRINETAAVLGGARQVELPHEITIPPIMQSGTMPDIFGFGAVVACVDVLRDIERRSADLLIGVAEARGLIGRELPRAKAKRVVSATIIPDPDRILAVLRVWMTFSLAFLLYIFVPDLPASTSVLLLSTIIGGFVAMKPTTPTRPVELLGTMIMVLAGFIHVIIMPKLSSFWGLGTILFLYMFVGAALLASPKAAPMRFIALGFAAMILQITPDQKYDFLYVADMLLAFQIPFILLWLTQSIPISFHPEDVFDRLLRRYMNSFEHLVGDMQYDRRSQQDRWWRRQWRNFHLRNLLSIPDKLSGWIGVMPKAAMSEDGRKTATALSQALYDVATRMVEFSRMRDARYSPETVERMRPTVRAWREALEGLSRDFRHAPDALPSAEQLTERLDAHLAKVRADTHMALNSQSEDSVSTAGKTLLRELAAYRGLSEALIRATRHALALNWGQLRETRL